MATKWKVRQFYGTYSEKVVEAESEEEARQLADCIGWNTDQVLSSCEWTGGEVETADADDELTPITDDDRDTINHYREWQRSQNNGGTSNDADIRA